MILNDSDIVAMYAENPQSDAEMIEFAREVEAAILAKLREQEPVVWKWEVRESSAIQKRRGIRSNVYVENPESLGISMDDTYYKWTLLYTHPSADAQDAARYRFAIEYLVSNRTDLDDAIVAAVKPEDITKVIDTALKLK
jgi:hypothetical protein